MTDVTDSFSYLGSKLIADATAQMKQSEEIAMVETLFRKMVKV